MKKHLKKLISLTLFICMLTASLSSATIYGSEITPRYNNVITVSSTSKVNSSGVMTITYNYSGIPDITTKAVITTYIEKQFLGIFWTRVDIGQTNNEWIQTINDYKYNASRILSLPSKGTYRVTVIYEIYGTNGSADKITCQDKVTY